MVNYPQSASDRLDRTFAALADPTRRAIVARLARAEANVGELAAPFAMSSPAITKHVKVLERAGLLVRQVDGRVHRCSLSPEPMHEAVEWIERNRKFWIGRFDALAAFLAQNTKNVQPKPRRKRA
jgi:DNA-binding transcriptional ArsR family regulator